MTQENHIIDIVKALSFMYKRLDGSPIVAAELRPGQKYPLALRFTWRPVGTGFNVVKQLTTQDLQAMAIHPQRELAKVCIWANTKAKAYLTHNQTGDTHE